MSIDVFERLGFSQEEVDTELKKVRWRYDRDTERKKKRPHKTAGGYKQEIEKLGEALEELEKVLKETSPAVKTAISVQFDVFGCPIAGLEVEIERLRDVSIGIDVPRRKDGPRNNLIRSLAKFYRSKSGKEPTVTVDPMTSEAKGDWPEFLKAAAERIGVDTNGIVRKAKFLRDIKRL